MECTIEHILWLKNNTMCFPDWPVIYRLLRVPGIALISKKHCGPESAYDVVTIKVCWARASRSHDGRVPNTRLTALSISLVCGGAHANRTPFTWTARHNVNHFIINRTASREPLACHAPVAWNGITATKAFQTPMKSGVCSGFSNGPWLNSKGSWTRSVYENLQEPLLLSRNDRRARHSTSAFAVKPGALSKNVSIMSISSTGTRLVFRCFRPSRRSVWNHSCGTTGKSNSTAFAHFHFWENQPRFRRMSVTCSWNYALCTSIYT